MHAHCSAALVLREVPQRVGRMVAEFVEGCVHSQVSIYFLSSPAIGSPSQHLQPSDQATTSAASAAAASSDVPSGASTAALTEVRSTMTSDESPWRSRKTASRAVSAMLRATSARDGRWTLRAVPSALDDTDARSAAKSEHEKQARVKAAKLARPPSYLLRKGQSSWRTRAQDDDSEAASSFVLPAFENSTRRIVSRPSSRAQRADGQRGCRPSGTPCLVGRTPDGLYTELAKSAAGARGVQLMSRAVHSALTPEVQVELDFTLSGTRTSCSGPPRGACCALTAAACCTSAMRPAEFTGPVYHGPFVEDGESRGACSLARPAPPPSLSRAQRRTTLANGTQRMGGW